MSKNGYFDDYEDNGLAPVDDNELGVAAEPEEDFDAFNSETFADGCEGGDEFWEEEHDKLIAMDGDDDAKEEQANEEFNGFKKSSKLDQIDLRQLPDPMISQQHASSLNVNNGHGNNNNSSYTPNQGIENLLLAQFLMQQQQQQRQHSPDIVAKQQQQQQQSILNTIQQQLNMPNQQSDQLNLQKLQLLQQQQQQLQQILQQQQMQQQKAATPSHFPPSASSSQSNMSSSSSQLNEIEIKLMQLFQLQQQLQQEITLQTAQQQKQHAALLASGSMPQSTLVNAQIKQTGHLIQQLQMKNQMNNNQITQLIMMRNNLMNARKTPVAQPSFNEILGNQEKENYLQSKLKELQINAATSSQQNSSSSPSNMDAMFKQSAAAAASAIYQQQLQKAAGMNPAILSMIQQQQQQQSMPAQPPLAPKALPNVKTLEELENELLNASKPKTPPKMDSNDIKTQQQQLEMIKLLSNLNIAGSGSNTGSNSPSLIQQQQNQQQHQQQQQSQDQQASMMLQKQILQAFLLQQNNQGAQHQQQQSQQQSQQQFALSNLSNQLKPNDQLIMQQHQQQLAARINNMLPPNFQHLTPQQKQLILSQRLARIFNKEELKFAC